MDEVSRERLRREVRLGRTLAHPRLVRMFELVEADGRLGVVMEWVPGGTLADRLRGGPLPVDDVIRVAGESLEALEILHGHGVVHRDVMPSNLLLDADGSVRLSGFGLVRPVESGSDLTVSSQAVGTPG
jgi:serine/threonine protein kinase